MSNSSSVVRNREEQLYERRKKLRTAKYIAIAFVIGDVVASHDLRGITVGLFCMGALILFDVLEKKSRA